MNKPVLSQARNKKEGEETDHFVTIGRIYCDKVGRGGNKKFCVWAFHNVANH